jgi:hypothetical protein
MESFHQRLQKNTLCLGNFSHSINIGVVLASKVFSLVLIGIYTDSYFLS